MGYKVIVNWPLFIGEMLEIVVVHNTRLVGWMALQKCTIEMGGLI